MRRVHGAVGTTREDEEWAAAAPTSVLVTLVQQLALHPRYVPPTRRVAVLNEAAWRLEERE